LKAGITGATGFLGPYLLTQMLEEYNSINVLTHKSNNISPENSKIHHYQGDITDPTTLLDFMESCDHVYHAAAKVGSWPKDPTKGYIATNIEGTKNVIKTADACNVKKIIYTSSFFALGSTNPEARDETWDNKPDFKHPYVTTKYDAGKIVETMVQENSYPIISVYPTTIIGNGMDNPLSALIVDYINGKLPGLPAEGGRRGLNFVDTKSVAKGHLLACHKGKYGEKYILGGENMTLRDFLLRFGNLLDIKGPRGIPNFVSAIYAWILERGSNPGFTHADLEVAKRWWIYESTKAQNELGYNPTLLEGTIASILEEFYTLGKLNKKGSRRYETYLTSFNT
jgi:farnesol dehydrogenase